MVSNHFLTIKGHLDILIYIYRVGGARGNGRALQEAIRKQQIEVCKYFLEEDRFTRGDLERGVLLAKRLNIGAVRDEMLEMLGAA
jgi:hypothetical protein